MSRSELAQSTPPGSLLWIMLREPAPNEGVPFRFRRLLPRIFGFELIVVWSKRDA